MNKSQRARKLTEEQVHQIRESIMPSPIVAKLFNVSPKTVRSVRNGEIYKFIQPKQEK